MSTAAAAAVCVCVCVTERVGGCEFAGCAALPPSSTAALPPQHVT
jgi:hypothetical protein